MTLKYWISERNISFFLKISEMSDLRVYAVYPATPRRPFHLIAAGKNDDLYKIIERYGIDAGKIVEVNNVTDFKKKRNKPQ